MSAAWFLTMAYLDEGRTEQARTFFEGMRPEFEKNYAWRHAWAILLAAEGKHEEEMRAMDEGTLKFAEQIPLQPEAGCFAGADKMRSSVGAGSRSTVHCEHSTKPPNDYAVHFSDAPNDSHPRRPGFRGMDLELAAGELLRAEEDATAVQSAE